MPGCCRIFSKQVHGDSGNAALYFFRIFGGKSICFQGVSLSRLRNLALFLFLRPFHPLYPLCLYSFLLKKHIKIYLKAFLEKEIPRQIKSNAVFFPRGSATEGCRFPYRSSYCTDRYAYWRSSDFPELLCSVSRLDKECRLPLRCGSSGSGRCPD